MVKMLSSESESSSLIAFERELPGVAAGDRVSALSLVFSVLHTVSDVSFDIEVALQAYGFRNSLFSSFSSLFHCLYCFALSAILLLAAIVLSALAARFPS